MQNLGREFESMTTDETPLTPSLSWFGIGDENQAVRTIISRTARHVGKV